MNAALFLRMTQHAKSLRDSALDRGVQLAFAGHRYQARRAFMESDAYQRYLASAQANLQKALGR